MAERSWLRHRRFLEAAASILLFCALTHHVMADEALLTLGEAVSQALAGNPGIAEIKARAEALAAVPDQEGALPDPSLNFDMLNVPVNSFSLRREDMTMIEVGLSQTIPFPGKLGLREKAAQQEALAAADSVEEARLRLARDVKQAWWRLFYFDRALNVTADAEKFFKELVDLAQIRYRDGQGTQADVLMAQLELSRLKDERLELIGMRHGESDQFNVLLNRKPETPVRIPQQAAVSLPQLAGENLQTEAGEHNPRFAQRHKMLDAAKSRIELAEKDYYPDLTVGAGYAVRQDTPTGQSRSDFASIRLSVNLPVYADRKQAKAVDQRRSELLREQYALEDEHNKVRGEIAAKTAEYRHSKEKLALFEHEIVPQAEQTVRSLMAGYPVGKANFSDLLRAEITLFQYQTQYWQSLVRTQQLLAELSNLVGDEVGRE